MPKKPSLLEQKEENKRHFIAALHEIVQYYFMEEQIRRENKEKEENAGLTEEEMDSVEALAHFFESRSSEEEEERKDLERSQEISDKFFESIQVVYESINTYLDDINKYNDDDLEFQKAMEALSPEELSEINRISKEITQSPETIFEEMKLALRPRPEPKPSADQKLDSIHPSMRENVQKAQRTHQEAAADKGVSSAAAQQALFAYILALRAGQVMKQNVGIDNRTANVLAKKFNVSRTVVQNAAMRIQNTVTETAKRMFDPKLTPSSMRNFIQHANGEIAPTVQEKRPALR